MAKAPAGKKIASIEGYNAMPIDAQMALPYCMGNVPASAWPEGTISNGVSWGLITLNGDDVAFTKYGSDMMDIVIAFKQRKMEVEDKAAHADAGKAGGEYLQEIEVFDVAELTGDQWDKFIKTICDVYLRNRFKTR